ncbi:ABC transporter ATP-binding protein [Helicobacter sp. 13S00477-4]|uniref:ABC transporter ATP-binding protein n=1 Tax=Helicobacter sp. 13S00477-4 TaxID=1905759 RepID=UPI002151F866|nr:ABC transporter ATP-binding protein [Helicobacter sp. 13S00477-4]
MLQIKGLCFDYHQTQNILKNINLNAKKGEFIGILGPNGCGKSTLIKQILGILKPFSGYVKLFNKDISHYNHKDLANMLGFLPQKSSLSMPLLVEDILYMGRYSSLENPIKGYSITDTQEIDKIASSLNIQHLKKRIALSLSGGEFQRVLLARALASNPKILLLDEPTSALDLNYALETMRLCEKLCKTIHITTIAVLHDINLAGLFCTKIFFIKGGKILYAGSPKDLFQPNILLDVYGFDCDVIDHNGYPFIIVKKEKK